MIHINEATQIALELFGSVLAKIEQDQKGGKDAITAKVRQRALIKAAVAFYGYNRQVSHQLGLLYKDDELQGLTKIIEMIEQELTELEQHQKLCESLDRSLAEDWVQMFFWIDSEDALRLEHLSFIYSCFEVCRKPSGQFYVCVTNDDSLPSVVNFYLEETLNGTSDPVSLVSRCLTQIVSGSRHFTPQDYAWIEEELSQ